MNALIVDVVKAVCELKTCLMGIVAAARKREDIALRAAH